MSDGASVKNHSKGTTEGKASHPSIVLQAIAHSDLYCSHLYVGEPGACNDLNVLSRDPYFQAILVGDAGHFSFEVNAQKFDHAYYLGDGIYPKIAIFVRPLHEPTCAIEAEFTASQESYRKDVERLFGAVQARFRVLRSGAHRFEFHSKSVIQNIVRACFLLHNMIISFEQGQR